MLFRDGNNEIAEVSIEEYDDNSDPRIELFKSLEAEQQHSNKFKESQPKESLYNSNPADARKSMSQASKKEYPTIQTASILNANATQSTSNLVSQRTTVKSLSKGPLPVLGNQANNARTLVPSKSRDIPSRDVPSRDVPLNSVR